MTCFPVLRSRSKARRVGVLTLLTALCVAVPAVAQTQLQQTMRHADDLNALYAAEAQKSELCKGYIGKVVTPTPFSALVQRLSPPPAKGEFETTAQYKARIAANAFSPPTGPVVVTVPVDRDFISYNADTSLMFIQVGAFGAGEFSDLVDVRITGDVTVPTGTPEGVRVPHGRSERLLRTYTARNGLGVAVKVSEFERQSTGFYFASPTLFSFAKRPDAPVLYVQAAPVQAPRLKQTLRVAVAFVPKAPYLFKGEFGSPVPTMRNPVSYENKLTVIYADPKCALALDPTGRVLAAVNAGS